MTINDIARDKISTDGLKPTFEAVFNKLDQPLSLGYCNVGVVHEVGSGIKNFKKVNNINVYLSKIINFYF